MTIQLSKNAIYDTIQYTLHDTIQCTLHDNIQHTLHDTIQCTLHDTIQCTLHDTIQCTIIVPVCIFTVASVHMLREPLGLSSTNKIYLVR